MSAVENASPERKTVPSTKPSALFPRNFPKLNSSILTSYSDACDRSKNKDLFDGLVVNNIPLSIFT